MSNFAAPYCKRVRYVGILRFHNILSTIMSSLFSWARQPNYLSPTLFCCDHYQLNLMGRFWFFSLSQLVLRSYNIVKTESVLKTENTFKVLFLNVFWPREFTCKVLRVTLLLFLFWKIMKKKCWNRVLLGQLNQIGSNWIKSDLGLN